MPPSLHILASSQPRIPPTLHVQLNIAARALAPKFRGGMSAVKGVPLTKPQPRCRSSTNGFPAAVRRLPLPALRSGRILLSLLLSSFTGSIFTFLLYLTDSFFESPSCVCFLRVPILPHDSLSLALAFVFNSEYNNISGLVLYNLQTSLLLCDLARQLCNTSRAGGSPDLQFQIIYGPFGTGCLIVCILLILVCLLMLVDIYTYKPLSLLYEV